MYELTHDRVVHLYWLPIEQLPVRSDTWLVGRAMPSEDHRLQIAFWDQETATWWLDEEKAQRLTWSPTYFAQRPMDPPWPPCERLLKHGASQETYDRCCK